MATFTYSYMLAGLFSRISDKDDDSQAKNSFSLESDHEYCTDSFSAIELLEAGNGFADDEDEFFYYENDDGTVYLFNGTSEAAVNNKVLRSWCADTGRRTCKKRKG